MEIDSIYYASDDWCIKSSFTEDDYEKYLDFGIEIGIITLNILKKCTNKRGIDIFKLRMNFTDDNDNTLELIGKKYHITRERTRQIIDDLKAKLYKNRYKYFNLLNSIVSVDIINYFIIGILSVYNVWFLKLLLYIIDKKNYNYILNNIFKHITEATEIEEMERRKMVEKRVYKSIVFPKIKNLKSEEIFWKLQKRRSTFKQNTCGIKYMDELKEVADYESESEKRIIGRFSHMSFVKAIKTQSLVINYQYKNKYYKYYPDIQILTKDNYLVIIEVKPIYRMLDKKVLIKYEALKAFCIKNGFGYMMIDEKNNTWEDIKKIHVSKKIETEFLNLIYDQDYINYQTFKWFKEKYALKTSEMIKIIFDYRDIIELDTMPFCMRYK